MERGVKVEIIDLVNAACENNRKAIAIQNEEVTPFQTSLRLKQGFVLNSLLLSVVLD